MEFLTGRLLKILILAGRLNRYDNCWPLAPWLDRLERRHCRLQVLCLARETILPNDSRAIEVPALGSRWLRGFATRSLWADERLERPDLIHVIDDELSDVALALSETWRLPYIQTVAGFRTLERGLRLSRRWCRQLVVSGPDLASGLVDELGIPPDRIAAIPPGILTRDDPIRTRGFEGVPVIGTGGPFDEGSGLRVFLEAARRVLDAGYDAEFVIAGRRDKDLDLRRQAQQLQIGERVTLTEFPFLGAEYWTVLDIYCQPAVVPTSGGALLQAMAHAVPSIATCVHGLRGLIEPGTSGLLVPANDPEALEAAIIGLLDHPEEARRLGRNARERIRTEFDPDTEADRLVELYRAAVG
jgi:glycosyltransferase involved in cell wall biosynthesis